MQTNYYDGLVLQYHYRNIISICSAKKIYQPPPGKSFQSSFKQRSDNYRGYKLLADGSDIQIAANPRTSVFFQSKRAQNPTISFA